MAGTFTDHIGGPGLSLKVPLRNYLGVTISEGDKIDFCSYGTYDYFSDKFQDFDIKNEHMEKLKLLQSKLSSHFGRPVGLQVGVLNELPRKNGLNNPGTNSANLAATYLLITEQITKDDLTGFQRNSETLEKSKIELIKSIAKEFHSAWLSRPTSGFGVSCSLHEPSMLQVYLPESRYPIHSLNAIYHKADYQEVPFDMIVIGTSDRNDIDFSLKKYDEIEDIFSVTSSDLERFYGAFGLVNDKYTDFNSQIIKSYFNSINETGVASIITMGKYLENSNTLNQEHCFAALNNSFDLLNILGKNFNRKNKVASFIKKYFHEMVSDMPNAITTGITNNLILFVPREHFRAHLVDMIAYLKTKLDFEITYPYVSWCDGYEESGTILEKWQELGLEPNRMPGNTLYSYALRPLGDKIQIAAPDHREDIENEYDIVLDEENKKMFIGGARITSKDLPTVSATLVMLEKIICSGDLSVEDSDLPRQSYFYDRNELQSKIISPLRQLVEQKTSKHLNIRVTGTIASYKVSLYPSDLSICYLKRK